MNLGGKRQVYEFIKDTIDFIAITVNYSLMLIGAMVLTIFLIITFPLWIIPYMIHDCRKSR